MTQVLREFLVEAIALFNVKNFPLPAQEAEEIVREYLHFSRADVYLSLDRELSVEELSNLWEMIHRRLTGEPLAYIVGEVDFFGCHFKLSSDVLIPRQETEILAALIVKELGANPDIETLLDLCTGSGCLGIAIKKMVPRLKRVILSDLSQEALALARFNALNNQVEVELLQGDLFAPLVNQRVDGIICNPPYVSLSDYEALDPEVREFEPKMALLGGVTGLEFYEKIAERAPAYLNERGQIWLEIGEKQGDDVMRLFSSPPWRERQVIQDWSRKDRFFLARL